jgi:ATP-dependent protease Clp ATPase subunit
MFEIPSQNNVKKVTITAECVTEDAEPLVEYFDSIDETSNQIVEEKMNGLDC